MTLCCADCGVGEDINDMYFTHEKDTIESKIVCSNCYSKYARNNDTISTKTIENALGGKDKRYGREN